MIDALKWIGTKCCAHCHKELTEDEATKNGSVCPYCGYCDTTDGTVYIRAKRWIIESPKTLFKKEKGHWEYGKRQVNR